MLGFFIPGTRVRFYPPIRNVSLGSERCHFRAVLLLGRAFQNVTVEVEDVQVNTCPGRSRGGTREMNADGRPGMGANHDNYSWWKKNRVDPIYGGLNQGFPKIFDGDALF